MNSLRSLSPLLAAAAILLAGNGLQGTLITLRAGMEGFDAVLIGLMGAGYYGGFLLSCLFTARLIRAVGHIRVFAGFAAIAASVSLMMVLWVDPVAWIVLRFMAGYCFAGLFMVIDSWINASVANEARAHAVGLPHARPCCRDGLTVPAAGVRCGRLCDFCNHGHPYLHVAGARVADGPVVACPAR